MSERVKGFSRGELRLLFRLIPEAERGTALNLRSHNPVDVEMVTQVQAYVDGVLGIRGSAFFQSSDACHFAALKGIRNILAGHVKNRWLSRWFFTGVDDHSLESLAVYLSEWYGSSRARWLRSFGLPKFLVLGLLLLGKRLKRFAGMLCEGMSECRDFFAHRMAAPWKGVDTEVASESSEEKRPAVLVLTSLFHPIVNFTVKSVVEELVKQKIHVVLVFHDGVDPRALRSHESWRWCDRMTHVFLESGRGSLSSWLSLIVAPRLLFAAIRSMTLALRRVLRATSSDWGMGLLLLRRVPVLIAGFHASLFRARQLISRLQPASVLSCDNGSENLHVKTFAYHCLRKGVRFYRYKPVPAYPVRQPVFNSASRFMLVTPEDAPIFRDNGSVPEFWDVGSPILDLAAPFVRRKLRAPPARNGEHPEGVRILFFTKRDFPNRGVISALSNYCLQNGRPATLTVKFHPSDARQLDLGQPDSGGLVKIVYYGREEIEHVDRLIFESDIVVSGSSNVIWSAFAQFKPVVYLAFKGMSSDTHVSGYQQYATSEFLVASELDQIGERTGRLIDAARNGGVLKHFARHDSLMRNFFCGGEFNSKERISRILSQGI